MIRRTLLSLALAVGVSGCCTDSPGARKNSNAASEIDSGAALSLRDPVAQIVDDPRGGGRNVFQLSGLSDEELAEVMAGESTGLRFQVYASSSEALNKRSPGAMKGQGPPLAGELRAIRDGVIFAPHFPLESGMAYEVNLSRVDTKMGKEKSLQGRDLVLHQVFVIPSVSTMPVAEVDAVYPSADLLPENLLKFYLHFTEPMRRGGVYEFIDLVDEKGRTVDIPFLEVAEELWDPEGTRLTVFIDPGRIKREVKPLEDVGPAMVEGGRYELVVSRDWPDEKGAQMKAEFRKSFCVGPPDRIQPDIKKWKVSAPRSGSVEPLDVSLDDALDHALLHRLVWVESVAGNEIAGEVRVSDNETRWEFIPKEPWRAGDYKLVADEWLEDRAGNRIGRLFEVDIFEKVTERIEVKTVWVPFAVR